MRRREFLACAAGATAAALSAETQLAWGLDYPTRPVRLIVPFGAGGSPDIIARLLAQRLADRLGQPFVVENRPGGSANIGTELALRAEPDGYTLLFALSSNAINPAIYRKLNFNFLRDAEPVAGIAKAGLVFEVNPAIPANTLPEFIAYAKSHPGKINIGSGGPGTPQYVAGALLQMVAGIKLTDVWYRGGEVAAIPDLLTGQIQALFGVIPTSLEHIQSGRLRALAVTASKREPVLPELPAMAEFLPGYEAVGWYGIVAPKGVPQAIVDTLNNHINAALADPSIKTRLSDLGCQILGGSPLEFKQFVEGETQKWAEVIKFSGVKVD